MDTILLPGLNDPLGSLSHLVGALVFLILGVKLIDQARFNQGWAVAVTVFVVSGVFLLSMSGIFHLLEQQNAGRGVLQRLDHGRIFALITGTFPPIYTVLFTGSWRAVYRDRESPRRRVWPPFTQSLQ